MGLSQICLYVAYIGINLPYPSTISGIRYKNTIPKIFTAKHYELVDLKNEETMAEGGSDLACMRAVLMYSGIPSGVSKNTDNRQVTSLRLIQLKVHSNTRGHIE